MVDDYLALDGEKEGYPAMPSIGVVLVGLMLCGCAIQEHGQRITPDDAMWITKGVTTRTQVTEIFGPPRFEVPLQSTTTSTTKTTSNVEGQTRTSTTTVQVNEPPAGTKATYLYSRSDSNIPFHGSINTTQFWLRYDEHGIVQDFGFVGAMPESSQ